MAPRAFQEKSEEDLTAEVEIWLQPTGVDLAKTPTKAPNPRPYVPQQGTRDARLGGVMNIGLR